MSNKKNINYINLPIFSKGKIEKDENINKATSRFVTGSLIIFIIILLLLSGYSMAKMIEEVIISSKVEIAEPILVVENKPSIDVTAVNNKGTYVFKIKNFNEQDKVTQADLQYYIEILSNLDDSINIELYQDENKIDLTDNKTEYIQISKDQKQEREYKLVITYDKTKDNTENLTDILEKIQIKVHTEQVKA